MYNKRSKTYEFLRSLRAPESLEDRFIELLEAVYALGRRDGHGEHNECLEIGVCDATNQTEEALARINLNSREQAS